VGRFLLALFVAVLTLNADSFSEGGIRLEEIRYPFEVRYIGIRELQMAYMDAKPEVPNGKTVVLLHGKNFTGAYWEDVAKALNKAGYRVIMPDQIGFGKSSKPEFYEYSFGQLAHNTKTLLDRLGVSEAYLVGHSMGGMLASRFTIMYPDTVEKLILENPIGLEDWQTFVPFQPLEYWYKKELAATSASMMEYQSKAYYDNKWKPQYDKWIAIQTSPLKSQNYPRAAYNQALISQMIFTQPVCYEFDKIKTSTLLIIGQRDKTAIGKELADERTKPLMGDYPKLGRKTAKSLKNSKLVELDGVGHLPHIESFDKFIEAVNSFLGKESDLTVKTIQR
jgi:pimeloyl-ACP methyl ester carboxylesterase